MQQNFVAHLQDIQEVLDQHVHSGAVPGLVAGVAVGERRHVVSSGTLSWQGAGAKTRVDSRTLFRVSSLTKPLVSAAFLTLIDDGVLALHDIVDEWLPELARMRVLCDPYGGLDNTVPAIRRITVADLLTCQMGAGTLVGSEGIASVLDAPIVQATLEAGRGTQSNPNGLPTGDEWLARLGELPLCFQPGERFMYNTPTCVLGVLAQRLTGQTLDTFMRERLFEPLGMKDSTFRPTREEVSRMVTSYSFGSDPRAIGAVDPWASANEYQGTYKEPAAGLITSMNDYLRFAQSLTGGVRTLSDTLLQEMTRNQLSDDVLKRSMWRPANFFEQHGWGLGVSVRRQASANGLPAGAFGWFGKWSVSWSSDPFNQISLAVFEQREPRPGLNVFGELERMLYGAIDKRCV